MRFVVAGNQYELDRDTIIRATVNVEPKPGDGRNKYYVELRSRMYPIKQPVHLVTGLPYIAFTAQDALRVLTKLGFAIHQRSVADMVVPVSGSTARQAREGSLKFAITLEEDEDGFIVASCPALPGCHSQGRSEEEAVSNVREAIRGYIASMRKHKEPIPAIREVREVEVVL